MSRHRVVSRTLGDEDREVSRFSEKSCKPRCFKGVKVSELPFKSERGSIIYDIHEVIIVGRRYLDALRITKKKIGRASCRERV